jgi:putative sigma-54 modulation protein
VVEALVKKNKSFPALVLSDKEAELNLSTLDHNFFIYADEKTKGIKVMYRRPDGNVGVIEVTNAKLTK